MGNDGSKPGVGPQAPLPRMILIVEAVSWHFKRGVYDTEHHSGAEVFAVCTLDNREPMGGRALKFPSDPIELCPQGVESELRLQFYFAPAPEGFAFGSKGLDDLPTPCATLMCPISKLARYGAPLYSSMWLGLDDAVGDTLEDNLQDAQRRARVIDAPKVKITVFKPFGADIANLHPDVKGALTDGQNGSDDGGFGCVGASVPKSYPRTVQVEGLIRNLDESNHVIRSLQDALFRSGGNSARTAAPSEELQVLNRKLSFDARRYANLYRQLEKKYAAEVMWHAVATEKLRKRLGQERTGTEGSMIELKHKYDAKLQSKSDEVSNLVLQYSDYGKAQDAKSEELIKMLGEELRLERSNVKSSLPSSEADARIAAMKAQCQEEYRRLLDASNKAWEVKMAHLEADQKAEGDFCLNKHYNVKEALEKRIQDLEKQKADAAQAAFEKLRAAHDASLAAATEEATRLATLIKQETHVAQQMTAGSERKVRELEKHVESLKADQRRHDVTHKLQDVATRARARKQQEDHAKQSAAERAAHALEVSGLQEHIKSLNAQLSSKLEDADESVKAAQRARQEESKRLGDQLRERSMINERLQSQLEEERSAHQLERERLESELANAHAKSEGELTRLQGLLSQKTQEGEQGRDIDTTNFEKQLAEADAAWARKVDAMQSGLHKRIRELEDALNKANADLAAERLQMAQNDRAARDLMEKRVDAEQKASKEAVAALAEANEELLSSRDRKIAELTAQLQTLRREMENAREEADARRAKELAEVADRASAASQAGSAKLEHERGIARKEFEAQLARERTNWDTAKASYEQQLAALRAELGDAHANEDADHKELQEAHELLKELGDSRKELTELRSAQEAELRRLRDEMATALAADRQEASRHLNDAKSECAELRKTHATEVSSAGGDRNQMMERFEADLEAARKELDRVKREADQARKEGDEAWQAKFAKTEVALRRAVAERDEALKKLEQLTRDKADELAKALKDADARRQAEIASMQDKMDAAKRSADLSNAKFTKELANAREEAECRLRQANEDADRRLSEQCRSLQTYHRMREGANVLKFNKDVQDKERHLEDERMVRAKETADYAAELERLRAQLLALQDAVRRAGDLEAELKAARDKLQAEGQSRIAIEAKLRSANEALEKLRAELAEENNSNSELQSKFQAQAAEMAKLQRQHQADLEAASNRLQSSSQDAGAELRELKASLEQEMADAEAAFAARMQMQQEKAQAELTNMQRQLEALRAELEASKKAANDREEELRKRFQAERGAMAKANDANLAAMSQEKYDLLRKAREEADEAIRSLKVEMDAARAERIAEREKEAREQRAQREKEDAAMKARHEEELADLKRTLDEERKRFQAAHDDAGKKMNDLRGQYHEGTSAQDASAKEVARLREDLRQLAVQREQDLQRAASDKEQALARAKDAAGLRYEDLRKTTAAQAASLRAELENAQNEVMRLKAELEQQRALSEKLREEAAKASEAAAAELSRQRQELNDAMAALKGQLDASNKKLQEGEAAFEDEKKQGAERLRVAEEKSSKQLEALRQKLEAELAARQKELANTAEKLKAVEQAAGKREQELLKEKQDEVNKHLKAAEEASARLKDAHGNELTAKEMEAKRLLQAEVQARQLAEDALAQTQEQLANTEAEVERLGGRVKELEAQLAKLAAQFEEERKALRAALEQAKVDNLQQVSELETTHAAKIKDERDHFAAALEQHDKDSKLLQAELESKATRAKVDYEDRIAKLQARLDALEQQKADELAALEKRLTERLEHARANADARARDLQATADEARAMLKEVERARKVHDEELATATEQRLAAAASSFEERLAAAREDARKACEARLAEQKLSWESKLADQVAETERVRREAEKQRALKEQEWLAKLEAERARAEKDAKAQAELIKDRDARLESSRHLEEDLKVAAEKARQEHQGEIDELTKAHRQLLESLKNKQKEAEDEILGEMEATRIEGEDELKKLKADYEERMEKLRQDVQKTLAEQTSKLRKDLEASQKNAEIWHKKADEEKARREPNTPKSAESGIDNKLVRIILRLFRSLVAEVFSNYKEEDLTRMFQKFDRDGSGSVTLAEFSKEIRRGFSVKKSFDMKKAFQKFDLHRTGHIAKHEFVAAVRSQLSLDGESVGHIYYLIDSGVSQRDGPARPGGRRPSIGNADGCIAEEEFAKLFEDPRLTCA